MKLGWWKKLLESWKRIFTVSKKPDWEEYRLMLTVTAIGIIIIGLIGFAVLLFFSITGLGRPA
ncbi:MAG: protein translocase SEC61 complex subunit gamma [Candidatus Diapherotrites archaeon]